MEYWEESRRPPKGPGPLSPSPLASYHQGPGVGAGVVVCADATAERAAMAAYVRDFIFVVDSISCLLCDLELCMYVCRCCCTTAE